MKNEAPNLRGRLLVASAVAGLLLYGGYLYRHACFAVGGSDSSGYANAARGLAHGSLVVPMSGLERFDLPESFAPAFTPLGFVHLPGGRSMAPLYPIGFPIHLAAAGLAFGWETAPYLVSPLAAVLCLVLMVLVGRELGLPHAAGAGAALLLASCPVFVFQAVQPMSDVVATLWSLAAIFAALRSRTRSRWALAAGFAFGVAVLVRPLDVLLALPLAFALPADRRAFGRFVAGGLPCAALLFLYDTLCFGRPFETGYAVTGLWTNFARANFSAHFPRYVRWTSDILTPLVVLGWLGALWDRRVPGRDRALLGTWFAVFLLAYSFYQPADVWWYTRFLLPGVPAVILGSLLLVRDLATRPAVRRWAVAAAVLTVVGCAAVGFRNARRSGALGLSAAQAVFPEACRWAADVAPPGALVLSMEMSGALRYYTGLTPVRWDGLAPDSFRTLTSRTDAAGASWYALLLHHEIAPATLRVPGRWSHLGDRGDASLWRLEGVAP